MEAPIRRNYDSVRSFENKAFRSACYAPFVSLYLTTYGGVLACCKNGSFTLGNVQRQRLRDMWEGEKAKELRLALREYRFDLGCGFCDWEIKGGNYQAATPLLFDELPVPSTTPEWPLQIEFEGSTTCNFACIMCNGSTSSSIRAQKDGLRVPPSVYTDEFFQDLRPFLPHLKRARFFGGEPFLTPESYRVWEMMIADGLTTECHLTTNGSQYNDKIERILGALPFFLTVSIDGATKDTVEKIRLNCRFEQLIENIHRFHAYTKQRDTSFHLAFSLMRQNWHEFGDLLLFAEDRGIEVWVNTVIDPSFCSLYTLSRHDLTEITGRLEKQGQSLTDRLLVNRRAWTETLLKLQMAVRDEQREKVTDVLKMYYDSDDDPLRKAVKLLKAENYSGALELARSVPENDANYYYALDLRGYSQGMMGNVASAKEDLTLALALSHKRPEAHVNMARTHLKQNCLPEAEEHALRAAELVTAEDRLQYEAAELLAVLYTRQGRLWQAQKVLFPIAKLQAEGSPILGLIYPTTGLRPQLMAEVEDDPYSRRASMIKSIVSVLLWIAKLPLKVKAQRSFLLSHAPYRLTRQETEVQQENMREFHWWLRVVGENRATLEFRDDNPDEIRVNVKHASTMVTHDIQLNYPGFHVQTGHLYVVNFRARADKARSVFVGVAYAHAPWSTLGLYHEIELTTQWQSFTQEFVASADTDNARIFFDLGLRERSVDFSSVTLRSLSDTVSEPTSRHC